MDMYPRTQYLRDLISLPSSLEEISERLRKYPWDCDGELVVMTGNDAARILERLKSRSISVELVAEWANLIECREDIGYESSSGELLIDIIFYFANLEINGGYDSAVCDEFLDKLNRQNGKE